MKKTTAVSLLAAEVALLTSVRMAVAAEAPQEGGRQQLEEVVVVATRKEQSVLDVPVSVSVFSSELIEQKNIQSAKDFLVQTPNVTFSQGGRGGAREIIIAIRGISDIKGGEKISTQSAFATYFDEFSVGTQATGQANPPLYDVQSVEVLRGPQGTFFGRNAEGGAINITSKKPGPDPYGQFDFGVGSFESYELSGVANVPVSDTLFTRLTVQSTTTDGPIENKHPTGGDSGADFLSVRGQVRWLATETTTVDLSAHYMLDQQDYTPKLATCINPYFGWNQFDPAVSGNIGCYDPDGQFAQRVSDGRINPPAGANRGHNDDSTYQNMREFTDNETTMVVARIQQDIGDFRLTSVTGRVASVSDQYIDLDKSAADVLDRSGYFDVENWSQEVRLSTTGERKLDWTIGGLYYDDSSSNENHIFIKDVFNTWMRGDHANENIINVQRHGWAAFANIEWHMTDQWSLIAGARYSKDTDRQQWLNVYGACDFREVGDPLEAGCELRPEHVTMPVVQQLPDGTFVTNGGRRAQTAGVIGETSDSDVSPSLALNWKPSDDTSMYVTVGKGFKGAGVRLNPDSGGERVMHYKGEELWNYEIGFNTWLLDRRLAVRGAIFHMDWTDMQVELRESFCRVLLPDGTPILIPTAEVTGPCNIVPFASVYNADSAFSRGVELSADALVGERWTFSAAVGYNEAEYKKYLQPNLVTPGTTRDQSGQPLGNAPTWTASASAEYRQQLFGGDVFVRLDGSYRSEAALGASARASVVWPSRVPGFALANMQIGMERDRQRVALVVNNLLGNDYYTATENSFSGVMLDYNPRTWFVKWTWRTE